MEKIHQGIGFTAKLKLPTDVAAKIANASKLYVVLRSPSTQATANATEAVVGYEIDTDHTKLVPQSLTLTLSASVTATMAMGAYSLEIFAYDKSEMFFFKPDFAFVLHSSAAGQNTPVQPDTEEPDVESDLTIQDVLDFIAEVAEDDPLS